MTTFKDIAQEITDLHERKNADYGNAFGKSYSKFEGYRIGAGLEYAVGRMSDKMERISNLAFNGNSKVKDESVRDTLVDLAAYAIMTIVEFDGMERPMPETEQHGIGWATYQE